MHILKYVQNQMILSSKFDDLCVDEGLSIGMVDEIHLGIHISLEAGMPVEMIGLEIGEYCIV
jgi:hypothetical protein